MPDRERVELLLLGFSFLCSGLLFLHIANWLYNRSNYLPFLFLLLPLLLVLFLLLVLLLLLLLVFFLLLLLLLLAFFLLLLLFIIQPCS